MENLYYFFLTFAIVTRTSLSTPFQSQCKEVSATQLLIFHPYI